MEKFPCYIHIEKCAGTTLHHSLKYNFPGYITLRPWYYWSNELGNYFTAQELKYFIKLFPILTGIGGHTTRTYLNYESVIDKPISYFTFLRNPIDRYMSHYNHQVNKMGINWTIEDFSNDSRFNNFMTRRIGGDESLTLAMHKLKNQYDFVGLFEHLNKSLVMLKHYVFDDQVDLFYEHKNDSTGEKKLRFNDLSENVKKRVLACNKLDIELYKYAADEIYPRQEVNYQGDIDLDCDNFERVNADYKYDVLRYHLLRSSKLLTDNCLQKVAHVLGR